MSDQAALVPELESESSGFDHWTGVFRTMLDDVKCRVSISRMQDGDNGAIWCEMQANLQMEGKPRNLTPPSRINLMNVNRGSGGWKGYVQALEDIAPSIRWQEAISLSVDSAIERYRNGDQEVALVPQGTADRAHPFLLEPFIASSGVSVFFGEGGTGKSLIGLGMAAAVASGFPIFGQIPQVTGPVVYFDYEDDESVHAERLQAIVKGHDLTMRHPVYHRSLIAKVSQAQSSMRQSIENTGAVLAVLDSIGMGRGGNANTSEDTVRMFRALRSLGVPTLAIDHVSKEDKRDGSLITPYGSVYTINSARLLWGAVVAEGVSTKDKKYLNLENTKANRTHLRKPMSMSIEYVNEDDKAEGQRWLDKVTFTTYSEWWEEIQADTWELIRAHLEVNVGAWTVLELALQTGKPEKQVEEAIQTHMADLVMERRGNTKAYALVGDFAREDD